ncbi:MAG: hypothetical protein ACYCW7_13835 [Pseudomonadaceae bacterium]
MFIRDLAYEVFYELRHLTLRRAWAWLTAGSGLRLLVAVVIVPLLLLLNACASAGPSVNGTEHAVTINWANAASSVTLPAAEAHCAQYGRHAQFSGKPNAFTDAYNCVKP